MEKKPMKHDKKGEMPAMPTEGSPEEEALESSAEEAAEAKEGMGDKHGLAKAIKAHRHGDLHIHLHEHNHMHQHGATEGY